jgi:hypothetical protein
LKNLRKTLNNKTTQAALVLKKILGEIQLEPISEESQDFYRIVSYKNGDNRAGERFGIASPATPRKNGRGRFKPYYLAHIKAQILVLLDKSDKDSDGPTFRWWAR